ncbi:MAG: imelysin family protein [Burkholderiaceae bacterium]
MSPTRRQALALLAGTMTLATTPAWSQAAVTAFPYYSGEQALQGLYGHHLPPLASAFETEAQALTAVARQHCAGTASADAVLVAWRRALLAWQILSSPALGPVVERRSQRLVDFWPARPALLQKALARAPQTLADMERVGSPAKGFPAMELLLSGEQGTPPCPFLALVAQGIEVEATALHAGFASAATRDWTDDEEVARTAFAEWINQWLGGLERLRWTFIEQPVQRASTTGNGRPPEFARRTGPDNVAEWQTQWRALHTQARLAPGPTSRPPQPGQDLIPIEALLMGKGHIALARRWAQVLDMADAAMQALPAQPAGAELMALSKTLKSVTTLYQGEVASALDVPLGFSDADGD